MKMVMSVALALVALALFVGPAAAGDCPAKVQAVVAAPVVQTVVAPAVVAQPVVVSQAVVAAPVVQTVVATPVVAAFVSPVAVVARHHAAVVQKVVAVKAAPAVVRQRTVTRSR